MNLLKDISKYRILVAILAAIFNIGGHFDFKAGGLDLKQLDRHQTSIIQSCLIVELKERLNVLTQYCLFTRRVYSIYGYGYNYI
jgi:hypothetical protein